MVKRFDVLKRAREHHMIRLKGYSAYFWIALFVLGDVALFSSRAIYLDEPFYIALAQAPRDYGLFFEAAHRVFFGTFSPLFGGGSHPGGSTTSSSWVMK